MTPKRLARRLTQTRTRQGLSQAAVAKRARIARQYLYKLETGQADPTVTVLMRLAKALGVPVTELLLELVTLRCGTDPAEPRQLRVGWAGSGPNAHFR
jgi:transcriptional regulator with XRE-family HTH domain